MITHGYYVCNDISFPKKMEFHPRVLFTIEHFPSKEVMDHSQSHHENGDYNDLDENGMIYHPGRSYAFLDGDDILAMRDGLIYRTGFKRFHTMGYFIDLIGILGEDLFAFCSQGRSTRFLNWAELLFLPLEKCPHLHFSKISLPVSSAPLCFTPFYRSIRFAKYAASKEEVKYTREWYDILFAFSGVKAYLDAFFKRHSSIFVSA